MLASTIKHAGITYDLRQDGTVTVIRDGTGEAFQLSCSEMAYLQAILQIHGWPVAPPVGPPLMPT